MCTSYYFEIKTLRYESYKPTHERYFTCLPNDISAINTHDTINSSMVVGFGGKYEILTPTIKKLIICNVGDVIGYLVDFEKMLQSISINGRCASKFYFPT